MQPQHISSQEVGIKNQRSSEKFCFLPLPSCCYFILLLMWKIVRGMKYWCDPMCLILHFALRVQVLSGSISQKYTRRKVLDSQRNAFDLLSKRKIFPFHYWASYYRAWPVLFNTTQTKIWYLPWLFALFTTLFLSLSCILLPPRLASITMWEASSPLTALSM